MSLMLENKIYKQQRAAYKIFVYSSMYFLTWGT